jgi:hypothetical protein
VIGGVKVSGYVDLLDTGGRLIDSKSSTKPIKGIAHDHRLQLTSYAMITPAASGACRLDTVTKGKTVSLVQKSFTVTEKGQAVRRGGLSHGAGLDPRRNLPTAAKQFVMFETILRLLDHL